MPRIISADLRFALTHIGSRDVYPSVRRGLGRTIAQAVQGRIPRGQIPQVLRALAHPLAGHEILSHLKLEDRVKPLLFAADALEQLSHELEATQRGRTFLAQKLARAGLKGRDLKEELRIAGENARASTSEMGKMADLYERLLIGLEYHPDTPLEDVFSHRQMLKAKLAELDEGCRKLEAELQYTNERTAATREELMSLLQTARAERDTALRELEENNTFIAQLRADALQSKDLKTQVERLTTQIEDLDGRIRELEEQRTRLEEEKREEAKGRTDAEARLLEKNRDFEKNNEEITRLRAEKAGLEVQLEEIRIAQRRLQEVAFALGPNISADIDAVIEAIKTLIVERENAILGKENERRVILADIAQMREETERVKAGLIEGLKAAGIIVDGMDNLTLLELVRRVNVGINNMARANEALRETLSAKGENEERLTGRVDDLFKDLQRLQGEIKGLNIALGYPEERDLTDTSVAVTAELETLRRDLQKAQSAARRAAAEKLELERSVAIARQRLISGAVVLSAQGAEIERLREEASNALKWQDWVLEIRRLDGVQTGSLLERDYAIFTDSPKGTKNSHLAIHARIIVGEGQIASLYCIAENSASWPAVKSYIKYRLAGRPMVDAARDSKLFDAENQTGIIIAEHDEREVVIIHHGQTQAMVVDPDPKVETLAFSTQGKSGAIVVSIPIAHDEGENMPALLLSSGALLGNPALEQRVIIAVQNPDDPSHIAARKIIAEAREIGVLDPISLALLTLGVKFDATNITSRTL